MRHGGQELSRPATARYITDAENVFMETMEVEEAKQYCNAHATCKGFTFAGPEEHPEDEARSLPRPICPLSAPYLPISHLVTSQLLPICPPTNSPQVTITFKTGSKVISDVNWVRSPPHLRPPPTHLDSIPLQHLAPIPPKSISPRSPYISPISGELRQRELDGVCLHLASISLHLPHLR